MPLARYQSTSGNLMVAQLYYMYAWVGTSWTVVMQASIPWAGTATYDFELYNQYYADYVYARINLNNSGYGPYTIPPRTTIVVSVDYAISSSSNINISMKADSDAFYCRHITIRTGNADCMYKVVLSPKALLNVFVIV